MARHPWPKDLPARVSLIQRPGLKTEERILPTLEGRVTAKRKKDARAILMLLNPQPGRPEIPDFIEEISAIPWFSEPRADSLGLDIQ